jgi:hypothetical protein
LNPYKNLPEKAFWKTAVANRNMFDITNLWNPKFNIGPKDNVATYGSCFAQHIGRNLALRGCSWLSTEPAPKNTPPQVAQKYNYGIFTSRTGNIYTTTLLQQWLEWSFGLKSPPEEIWQKGDRYFDPFRPAVEPNGFSSEEELLASRQTTLNAFKRSVETSKYFVFTLGLTESWVNSEKHYEYPMCPGTVAGEYDSSVHKFSKKKFFHIRTALESSIEIMRGINPELKFILTVSPVPLTATKSGDHVLVATMMSKSTLRAVAGEMAEKFDYVDYFPSYEVINSAPFKGAFFEPNQRSVNHKGVELVMSHFFSALEQKYKVKFSINSDQNTTNLDELDVICEEEILQSFSK